MVVIRPRQPHEIDEAHRRAATKARAAQAETVSAPPTHNVDAVLTVGDTTYRHFRGRAYGVPPLPWKAGQRITALQGQLHRAMDALRRKPFDEAPRAEYYLALAQLPDLLWANCRPTTKWRRFLRAIGAHANPFADATDRELLELADFFSSCRMRSGAQFRPMLARQGRPISSTM